MLRDRENLLSRLKREGRSSDLVVADLIKFHEVVKPGDSVLIMRPDYAAQGVYSGATEGRFNLREQFVDLEGAVVVAPNVFDLFSYREVAEFLSSLPLERDTHSVELGNRDFLVFKVPAPTEAERS
jgi:hypothetical protein